MKLLQKGDHIRVISPSDSIHRIGGFEANLAAKERLEALGFKVSFSKNYLQVADAFGSTSIASRVADFHEAFLDDSVDLILATIGGFNSNELLPYLDYDLIRQHPKLICGYSDSTAFLNAIYAKTGLQTFMGPAYSSFKMNLGQDYQTKMWLEALSQPSYELLPSKEWSSDAWFIPDSPRQFKPTAWKVYANGRASGTLIGGNLSTFSLLSGTDYAPQESDYILLIEEAEGYPPEHTARQLAALLQVYPNPKALLIGRFPKECQMTEEVLHFILDKHPILKTIPVLYDLDFAHTQPLFTVAIGGQASINTKEMRILVERMEKCQNSF
ncbi:Muramoyltetrapeptide carboxypeptidase LdcA (peptidoglycan recycling) [Streptococcus henryi]|uniref:Muramoyltetrapeptide carboxypeptidase LdcA (Peptidoglycan recycling) n=1 Tax=Streptococcus henryi TaxID=439219 RepID=A0A1G6D066_9STRE|nr:S66 peptidase family protein [Streptococcus henryi]SDB38305.1 Muramoyltetrapeptide carboxypeptidase LdcA (peptidoglycan recycling) [Streptococcus henryi]